MSDNNEEFFDQAKVEKSGQDLEHKATEVGPAKEDSEQQRKGVDSAKKAPPTSSQEETPVEEILRECPSIRYTSRIIKGEDSHGHTTINHYSIFQDLGEGSFGLVRLAKDNET